MKIGEVRGGPAAWRMRSPGDQSLPKLKVEGAIRCTVPSCSCDCFTPGKINIRYCDGCNHSWVPHALDKLGEQPATPCVEPVQPNAAFDIASLVLYGCQALPIRLKILLDRLFSVLRRDEVLQVLAGFGWTQDDYARGYILQDANSPKSETWNICSSEEEPLVLRQFLRFGETRSIAMELLQTSGGQRYQKKVPTKPIVKEPSKPATPQPTSPVLPVASTLSTSATQSSAQLPLDFRVQNAHKVPNNCLPMFTNAYNAAAFNMSALLSKPNVAMNLFGATSPTKMNHLMSNNESVVTSSFAVTSSLSKAGCDKPACDENATPGVLNLSRDAVEPKPQSGGSPRKQPSSSRRPWSLSMPGLPVNLGTQLVNQVTGKKRVQCNVCLKTFCDKGALKIHFSAVHLREMHKCTVDGCNMMFSSRRSRNRHSANPNPKLHSPHMRRKMSPHDGRSALAHTSPRLGDIAPMGQLAFPMLPTAQLQPKSSLRSPRFEDMRHNDLTNNNTTFSEDSSKHFNNQQDDDETMDERDDIVVDYSAESEMFDDFDRYDGKVSDSRQRMTSVSSSYSDDESLTKQEDSEDGDFTTPTLTENHHATKDEVVLPTDLSSSRSSHKRKSNHPTKCSNAQETKVAQRADEKTCADDEDSKSVVGGGGCSGDLRVKELGELMGKKEEDDKCEEKTGNLKPENEDAATSETSGTNPEVKNSEQDVNECTGENDTAMDVDSDDHNRKSSEGGLVVTTDDEKSSVNALKHLENLSNGPLSSGDPRSDDLNSSERSPDYSSAGSQDDDSQFFFPDSGNLFGSVDIPIDKDNPRRCTACGKIFQNHFGVKTHFQNVHLKLLHKCSVDGCNAAFPSKRSRDRHSANANLHRKLLSTSSNSPPFPEQIGMGGLPTGKDLFPFPMSPTLHSQFMSRLYAEAQTPANLEIALKNLQAQMAFNGSGDLAHNDHSLLQPSPAAAAGLLMMSPLVLQDLANLSAHFRSRVNGESLLGATRTTNGARDLLEPGKVSHSSLDLPMP